MTAHVQAFVVEAVAAGVGGMRRVDDAFGHERQSLCRLERGAWGVHTHDAAVQQWFPYIAAQLEVTLGTLSAHHDAGVVAGR